MRATTDEQKRERRESILSAAAGLYDRGEYDTISVARIAAEAGIAKGTVFVYFGSKEAIFLELARRSFEAWFAAIALTFTGHGDAPPPDAEAAARLIAGTLADRYPMLRLASLSHAILERNVALEESVRFKRAVLDSLGRLAEEIGSAFPAVPSDRRLDFMMGLYSIILGATAVGMLPPDVRSVLAAVPRYRDLDRLLERLLVDTVASYLRGFAAA